AVDDSILGGMVLHMGDRVLDASLRAQLSILRETFKRGE
ncbi:MAG: F0F1 ATP synthase subunit delta, partial [Desulfovibrio sp.]|nr:F0F1 ATP synthase subunit delta [Desulfovibrio sp.]